MPDSAVRQLRLRGEEPLPVTVTLRYEHNIHKYYCFCCRSEEVLFASHGRVIGMFYGNHIENILVLPVSIPCHTCGAMYFIAAMNQ